MVAVIYTLRGYLRLDSGGFFDSNKPEWWKPRLFSSLKQAKDYADSRIENIKPGEHVVLEIEEWRGARAKTGLIKYRVERDLQGNIERTPVV